MQDEVNPIYENRQSKVTGRPVVITAYYVPLMLQLTKLIVGNLPPVLVYVNLWGIATY